MNLYRSFGNLMEVWVTKEGQCSHSELLGRNDETSPSPSTNLRSESVDSGVEMASSDMSFHATELDGFTPDREGSARASDSSVLSCPSPSKPSSPCLPPSGAQDHSNILHQKVEAALQRSNSKHLKDKPAVEIRRRDSRAHQGPTSESLRGQRSDRFDLRRMFNPSEPMRLTRQRWSSVTSDILAFHRKLEDQLSSNVRGLVRGKLVEGEVVKKVAEAYRSLCFDWSCNTVYEACHDSLRMSFTLAGCHERTIINQSAQDLSEDEAKGLSPGLCYLEHVCQRLEEFAKQQRHNQALQRQKNALQTHLEAEAGQAEPVLEVSHQASDSCQTDSGAAGTSGQRQENKSEERSPSEGRHPRLLHRHFRQRSASDANVATLHLRMKDTACRGQHLSTDDLLIELNKDLEKQGTDGEKKNTLSRSWKTKIGSLTRNFSVMRDVKSQQMQSTERKQAWLRLSQLFRRNKKKTVSP